MTTREAERLVILARRRKKNAPPGKKIVRLVELQQAVTAALRAAAERAKA